jgi:hypothetical protein
MNRAGMVPGGPEHVSAKNLLRRGLSRVLRQTGAPEQGVQVLLGETFAREYFEGTHPAEQIPMFTAPPFHNLVAETLQTAQLAEIYDTHLLSLEREAVRFENVASRLEEEDRQAVLVFVVGLRQEIQTLHRQIEPSVHRGW